jgi:glycosyltransferase involved in cell wall biosynthesis
MRDKDAKRCLTYIPIPHLGFGFVQICVSILEHFPKDILSATLVLPRTFRPISSGVDVKQAIPPFIPYRYVWRLAGPALSYRFARALATADPQNTVAYFWPGAPLSLVRKARKRGFLTVREMINTFTGTAKVILDDAYTRAGLRPDHSITDDMVVRERDELSLYDHFFSANPMVEKSLIEAGVDPTKILRSTYGWLPSRFASSVGEDRRKGFRALFVGTICVRKGVPQLLAAWKKSGIKGELLLAGDVEDSIKSLLGGYVKGHGVRVSKFVSDVGILFKSSDIFVFPTLEEGGPLVTYEALGCGLPVITTLMGGGGIVKSGVNGLLVEPYDVDGLADAISLLAKSPELTNRLARQAAKDAQNYTFDKVGKERARVLSGLLAAAQEPTRKI